MWGVGVMFLLVITPAAGEGVEAQDCAGQDWGGVAVDEEAGLDVEMPYGRRRNYFAVLKALYLTKSLKMHVRHVGSACYAVVEL